MVEVHREVAMQYYPDGMTDYFMKHPVSNPRYTTLARKAISHYLGDRYNPETFNFKTEVMIRRYIKGFVELKVQERVPYDWSFIDNFLRKVIHDDGFTHISYDINKITCGYHGIRRSELPKHYA